MKLTHQQAIVFNEADARVIDAECIPLQLVPIVARMLVGKTFKGAWRVGDGAAGKDATVRVIMSIYAGCLSPTAKSVDRLYRLHSNVMLGIQYDTMTIAGVEVVSPAIPSGQPLGAAQAGLSMLELTRRLRFVLENALLGQSSAGLVDIRNYRDMLQELIDKPSGDSGLDDEMLAELLKIAAFLV